MVDKTHNMKNRVSLRRLIRFARSRFALSRFYMMNAFRRSAGGRRPVKIAGNALIYDIFPCRDNKYIAVIGRYGAIGDPEELVCGFQSGEESKARWIDDGAHEYEGQQVLICFFRVPEADRRAGQTLIYLRSRDSVVMSDATMHFEKQNKKHYLSVATLMKDEDPYLIEWIEYYRVLGAEHFYIYDNRSIRRGRIRRILRPYIDRGIVTLLDWDYPYALDPKNTWRFCQRGQMHHCLYKYGEVNSWLLFIDVDEFIYPVDHAEMSLLPLLRSKDTCPEVAALQFKMVWFGNSGHRRIPAGLVTENYTHRAAQAVEHGREKCCVKPEKVELLFIHDIKKCAEGSEKSVVPPELYRINHYYATSSARRRRSDSQFNEVEDAGMSRFVPELRKRLGGS